jgi:hypothetical protein
MYITTRDGDLQYPKLTLNNYKEHRTGSQRRISVGVPEYVY